MQIARGKPCKFYYLTNATLISKLQDANFRELKSNKKIIKDKQLRCKNSNLISF